MRTSWQPAGRHCGSKVSMFTCCIRSMVPSTISALTAAEALDISSRAAFHGARGCKWQTALS